MEKNPGIFLAVLVLKTLKEIPSPSRVIQEGASNPRVVVIQFD